MKNVTAIVAIAFSLHAASLPAQTSPPASHAGIRDTASVRSYILSNLSTSTEASDLVTTFKARPGVINAWVDLSKHTLSVVVPKEMFESDLLEVIRSSGKEVLTDPDQVQKYY